VWELEHVRIIVKTTWPGRIRISICYVYVKNKV
jgi:hypothetical protein